MTAKFSIVIPVFNVAGYLPACIDSIVTQRCPDIEVILVDDKSTDESSAICDCYSQQHGNVHVIHLDKNQGVAAARNHGLAAATGDYIIFVDGDDCLVEGSLERVSSLIERVDQIDIIICRYISESKVHSNGAMFIPGAAEKVDAEIVLKRLTRTDYYLDHCWPYVINRDLIVRNGVRFISSTIAEDAEYIVRLFALAASVAYCEGVFYLYREREGSLKNSKGVAQTVSFLHVAHALQQLVEAGGLSDVRKAFVASQIRHSLGVFAGRFSLLDAEGLRNLASVIGPEKLPSAIRLSSSGDIAAALMAYRKSLDNATLTLVSEVGTRPLYIYCTGPSSEAVIQTLLRAGYTIQKVIDDNESLRGQTVLGIPITTAAHFSTLSADELRSAFIVVCIQKKAAYEKISLSLVNQGISRDQIVHRMF